jgi:hypothetical protein
MTPRHNTPPRLVTTKVRKFSAKTERELAAWRASKTPEQVAQLEAEWNA